MSNQDIVTARVEEKFRAASQALTETFPDASMPPRRPAAEVGPAAGRPGKRALTPRRAGGWLVPLGAAAAVVAVTAASLVVAHSLGEATRTGVPRTAGSTQAAGSTNADGLPPYYAFTTGGGSVQIQATSTGRTLTTIAPPHPYHILSYLSGARDDRTFVAAAWNEARPPSKWPELHFYLIRFDPGSHRARLSPLPISFSEENLCTLALSPDGTKLAASFNPFCNRSPAPASPLTITVYSVSTGRSRSWVTGFRISGNDSLKLDLTGVDLSWRSNSRDLGFTWVATQPHQPYFAVLNTGAPGAQLPDGLLLPAGTVQAAITPDGQLDVIGPGGRLIEYSSVPTPSTLSPPPRPATGFSAQLGSRLWMILWADAPGRVLVVWPYRSARGHLMPALQVGVLRGGHYRRLPAPVAMPVW